MGPTVISASSLLLQEAHLWSPHRCTAALRRHVCWLFCIGYGLWDFNVTKLANPRHHKNIYWTFSPYQDWRLSSVTEHCPSKFKTPSSMLSSQEHLLPFKLFRTLQFRKFHLFTPSHKANYWQEWDQTVCPHCLVSALSPLQDHDHTPPIYSSDKWGNNHPAESFSSSHTLECLKGPCKPIQAWVSPRNVSVLGLGPCPNFWTATRCCGWLSTGLGKKWVDFSPTGPTTTYLCVHQFTLITHLIHPHYTFP